MIKYIKNTDLKTLEFENSKKDFFQYISQDIDICRQAEYPFCYQYSKLKGNEIILDAGCGYTVWPYFLKKKWPKVDMLLVDLEKELLDKYKNDFKTFLEPMQQTSFLDKSVDIIYSISTLEHTPYWKETMIEFNRLIKDSGKLIMIVAVDLTSTMYFKERNIRTLIEVLSQRFVIDDIDFSKEDALILKNRSNGKFFDLAFILDVKKS